MRHFRKSTILLCSLGLLWTAPASRAGTNLVDTTSQGAGANWTAAIWKTNDGTGLGVGTAVAPIAGNTYSLVSNGTKLGNGAANTRLRNPANQGLQTFPGDQLTIGLDTEIRAKGNFSNPTTILGFFGVSNAPGLICYQGSVLNMGDDGTSTFTGLVQIASQTYVSHANNGTGGGLTTNPRNIVFNCILSGGGNMVIINAKTNTAQTIGGNANTFSGQWTVQAGWLLGAGTNSLGTNSITVDPGSTDFLTDLPNASSANGGQGSAVLEVNYDMNNAGALVLQNGGVFRLHQNCEFSSVTIEGTALSPGTHFASDLITAFPGNFLSTASGTITVQPFGPPPKLAPIITVAPAPQTLFAGKTAHFNVSATSHDAMTFHWRKGGNILTDSGNISGSGTSNLTVSAVSAADAGAYDVVVSSAQGSVTSSVAALTIQAPSGAAYEAAVESASPVAYYELNEIDDPSLNPIAYDYAGGFNGNYGNGTQNGNPGFGISGPTPATGFPGFPTVNGAVLSQHLVANSFVTVPALNLNTNTVTMTAWIFPQSGQTAFNGIVFYRGGSTVAGLNYGGSADSGGNVFLGYTWNNEAGTYNWNSSLIAPINQWSLVALAVGPTNANIYVLNTSGLAVASHAYVHSNQTFAATGEIGGDSNDGGNGSRTFAGIIDDVAIYNSTLSQSQLVTLYAAGSGSSTTIAPSIATQPVTENLYIGQTAQFFVVAGGNPQVTYQWQRAAAGSGAFSNISDGGRISGSQTAVLTIANVQLADTADFRVIVSNSAGNATSGTGSLIVNSPNGPTTITMSVQQVAGNDWDTPTDWSNGQSATVSSFSNPGSTYEVLAGARIRTPAGNAAAVFPGAILQIDGDGVFTNSPAVGASAAEVRFKQPSSGSTVYFPKLVMNGGQLDNGNPGLVIIQGEIDILTNTPIYVDSGGGTGRPYQIDAWLTGTGSIEYHDFDNSLTSDLNVTGTSNTFSGTWDVVMGVLLGSAPGSLGTNNITVEANGALETTYNLISQGGTLTVNGQVFLHENDAFNAVIVNGTSLPAGVYTYSQLHTSYPTNFPATWTLQSGSAVAAGSGSIRVLAGATYVPPVAPTIGSSPTIGAGGAITFTVNSQVGSVYTLQYKNTLTATTWTSLPSVPGNGGSLNLTDSTNAGVPTRYYRVLVN